MRCSKNLTQQEALSLRRRLRYHFSMPRTGSNAGTGPWASPASSYADAAVGWASSYTRMVSHSVNYSITLNDALEALDGTNLRDGLPFSISPAVDRTTVTYVNEVRPSPGVCFGMAGQSNSIGTDTDLTSLPGTWPPADTASRLKKFTSAFVALAEPVNGAGGTHAVSFADAIARDAAYTGNVAIVPAPPVNGTSIDQWQRASTGNYANLLTRMILCAENYGYTISGILWYQGEADTLTLAKKNAFKALTQQMIADFRMDLCEPTLPFVIARLPNGTSAYGPYWSDIQTLQDEIAAEDSNVVLVQSPHSGPFIDSVHLATSTQKTLGELMAAAYLARY